MTDAAADAPIPKPDAGDRARPERQEPLLAADGSPLKKSLQRSLRRQKLRAFGLVAPLLLFVLVTFIAPIADMLFRSVENQIVSETLPRTVVALEQWDPEQDELPSEDTFLAMAYDLVEAQELKIHTRLGTRLNYETTGISSLFRRTGRGVDDFGEIYLDQFEDLNPNWDEAGPWVDLVADEGWEHPAPFEPSERFAALMSETAAAYASFARAIQQGSDDNPREEEPWAPVHMALYHDLMRTDPGAIAAYEGPRAEMLREARAAVEGFESQPVREMFVAEEEDWLDPEVWATIKTFSPPYTPGYFLTSVDLKLSPDGEVVAQDEDQRIYMLLFQRTLFMSLMIMGCTILLGYPIAYLISNLPLRTANLLLILVLLPFWTSLLVRTSAWKVLLQQQGVINDTLVWIGLVADDARLTMINNQFGTIVAMTHILLPFMILPLYSVMKTIPPSYVRAAKSLGATNWTAFWRVYFPQSVPGIGAGCILVFILSIGYYITPELVGGTTGTFISNRIAFHISSSLNWGLAAALGTILLVVVLVLYWVYDRIVGIDNVSLG
ncbi:ABC transporter permease [Rhodovulum sp. 12E13]|uniref:ABC transporter permease n=1 Tax=Rhodovulum sp. 12E13 TaxID=2203891 RepID=UPI000E13D4F0|nr:ABC transporter permease [Rhodovulum sp. 12E13]RDC74999.1 ABC transporter permease [Rhodovulum sp. 12E13]